MTTLKPKTQNPTPKTQKPKKHKKQHTKKNTEEQSIKRINYKVHSIRNTQNAKTKTTNPTPKTQHPNILYSLKKMMFSEKQAI